MSQETTSAQVYIAHGDSDVLKRRAVEGIISEHLTEEEREYGLTQLQVPDSDIDEITNVMSSGSLFASEQVLVLHNLDDISKTDQQPLVPVLEGLGPGMIVVMTARPAPRGPAKKPNLSSPLVKYVKKAGKVIDCNTPPSYDYNDELTPWVRNEAERYGKSFAPGAVEEIISLVGESCDRLASEIDKLSLYLGDRDTIETEDVRKVVCVTADEDIFGLTDAVGERNATRALEVLPDLVPEHASSGSGIPVLAMIARHVRLLWQARLLLQNNIGLKSKKKCPDDILQRLPEDTNIFSAIRGRGFLVRKYRSQARNFSDGELARSMVCIYEADRALKGQTDQRMDDRLVLEKLIMDICRQ